MRNISLSGRARSGKDTFAKVLIDNSGYKRLAFADELKRVASEYFYWDGEKDDLGRTLLQHIGTEVGRSFCEDIWLIKFAATAGINTSLRLPDHEQTYKDKLQALNRIYDLGENNSVSLGMTRAKLIALIEFGWTGVMDSRSHENVLRTLEVGAAYRQKFTQELPGKDFWVAQLKKSFERGSAGKDTKIVVTDTRFPNEADFLAKNGFKLVKIVRPGIPAMSHASETALDNYTFESIVGNAGTEEEFLAKVMSLHGDL